VDTNDSRMESSPGLKKWEAGIFAATRVLFVFCFVIAICSTYFITQEWDEAIIYGTLKQGLIGSWQPLGMRPPITTGGLHSFLQGLVFYVFGPDLIFVRFVALSYLVVLAKVMFSLFDLPDGSPREANLLLAASVLAVPGVFFHSTLAFSCTLAIALFFVALKIWMRFSTGSRERRVYTGLVLGLAIATRFNFFLAIPLFCIDFAGTQRREYLKDGIVIGTIAILTFLLSAVALLLATNSPLDQALFDLLRSIGVWNRSPSEWGAAFAGEGFALLDLVRPGTWLNRWQQATQIFPLPIIAISTAYAWVPVSNRSPGDTAIMRLIVTHSWLAWIAWIVITPFPFLRYLLPSLIGFALVFGHLIVQLYLLAKKNHRPASIILPVFALASLVNCTVMSARQLYIGDSRRIVTEFAGRHGATTRLKASPFAAALEERELADYVRDHLDDRQTIAVQIAEYYQLMFSSGKQMKRIAEVMRDDVPPQWIIIERDRITPQNRGFLEQSYFPLREFRSYVIFQRK
jgi:hypothetical protein